MNGKRNAAIDVGRLICAWLVIAIHTHPFPLVFSDIYPVLSIAVPYFFVIAGWFFRESTEEKRKALFKRLLREYVLWSLVYMLYEIFWIFREGEWNVFAFFRPRVGAFFVHGVCSYYWFIVVLLYLYILFICAKKYKFEKALLFLSVAGYIVGFLSTSYCDGLIFPKEMKEGVIWDFISNFWCRGMASFGMICFLPKDRLNRIGYKHLVLFGSLYAIEIWLIGGELTITLLPLVISIFVCCLKAPVKTTGGLLRYLSVFLYMAQGIAIDSLKRVMRITDSTQLFFQL